MDGHAVEGLGLADDAEDDVAVVVPEFSWNARWWCQSFLGMRRRGPRCSRWWCAVVVTP
jgi:hypothetical protein